MHHAYRAGLAEHTGLIHPLTAFVLEEAATQWAAWRREGRSVGIAVNISAVQFRLVDLLQRMPAILLKTGLSPGCLEVEITKCALIEDLSRGHWPEPYPADVGRTT